MGTLPQLTEEDIRAFDGQLRGLIENSDATTAMIIDQGGFLITSQGEASQFDLTTIAALASGSFLANQTIAGLVHETNFSTVYQQGENHSMFIVCVDDHSLLVVIFQAHLSAGVVKYFALPAARAIAAQMKTSLDRAPDAGLDLSVLNLADTGELFKRQG